MTKRYYPEKFNVITSVDDTGAITDIPRINGEDLYTYKKRILESSQRLANSSYEGLINGINRELGLDRKKIIEIDLKNLISGSLDYSDITFSQDTISDNREFTGTVNATNVVAVGNKLTDSGRNWIENSLVGLCLTIGANRYKILSNTNNSVIIDGSMSNLGGQTYTIKADWTPNSLIGLAIHIGKKRFTIIENTNKIIRIDGEIINTQGSEYHVTANTPRVEVTTARLYLYKEYHSEQNYQLDVEIDIRTRGMQHSTIVNIINANSAFFIAKDLIPFSVDVPAFTIKKQDSDKIVLREAVPGTKFFKLENKNIKSESIKFSETDIFLREVNNVEEVAIGPYYSIDYKQGIVRAKNVPNGTGIISYKYMDFPFKIESSPAIVTPFADKESELFLFAQKEKRIYEDQRDRYISSQPKSNMIEYISELLKVTDQSWGK